MKIKLQALIVVLIFDFLSLIFVTYHLAYQNRIYPGVSIVNQSVGNRTPGEAVGIVQSMSRQTKPNISLTFRPNEQEWLLDLEELEFSYQTARTAQKAYQIGRSGKISEDFTTKIRAWRQGINLKMECSLNQNLLEAQIATIASQIFIPAVEPSIKVVNQKIEIEREKEGREIDKQELASIINYQLSIINFNPIELPIITTFPALAPEQVEKTRQRAEKFLGKKLILTEQEKQWKLGEEELVQLLSFTGSFDQSKIASWSANLASAIDRPPENAAFQYFQGRVTEFRPAREGKALGQEKTVDLISQSLGDLEEGQTEINLKLPLIITPPSIKTADVNSLGIKQPIGQGVSYFRGSISSRIYNIQLASSKLHGLLISPDEVFSFNQTLGEVSKASGYKEAYIIKEGRTILGDGGGVCQVSTTLFRAALDAGLPIVERRAHAYRVYYYEQNSPVGLDATVFAPTVDLKFKNDTPAHILIQTRFDLKNKSLAFNLYGTHDGRIVTLSKPKVWDQVPPPPDLYQDDPTLPAGTVEQIDWQAWGAKVAFDYQVKRNGEILQSRTFYSAYRPWQAVYLRGTKPATQ